MVVVVYYLLLILQSVITGSFSGCFFCTDFHTFSAGVVTAQPLSTGNNAGIKLIYRLLLTLYHWWMIVHLSKSKITICLVSIQCDLWMCQMPMYWYLHFVLSYTLFLVYVRLCGLLVLWSGRLTCNRWRLGFDLFCCLQMTTPDRLFTYSCLCHPAV